MYTCIYIDHMIFHIYTPWFSIRGSAPAKTKRTWDDTAGKSNSKGLGLREGGFGKLWCLWNEQLL